jgi:hypothetical protein
MNITEKLNEFIAANGGSERDALNVALTRLEISEQFVRELREIIKNDTYDTTPAEPETCKYTKEKRGDSEFWVCRSCSHSTEIRYATIPQNEGLNYCPYCGKLIEVTE